MLGAARHPRRARSLCGMQMRFATDLQNAIRFAMQHFHYSTNILVQTTTCSKREGSAPPLSIFRSDGRNGLDRGLPPADRVVLPVALLDRWIESVTPRDCVAPLFECSIALDRSFCRAAPEDVSAGWRPPRITLHSRRIAPASASRTAAIFFCLTKKRSRTARFARWQFNEYPVPASLPRATRPRRGIRRKSSQRCAPSIAAPRARAHPAA